MSMVPMVDKDEIDHNSTNWERIWSRQIDQTTGKSTSIIGSLFERILRKGRSIFEPDSLSILLSRIVRNELSKETDQININILEPGCGSGQSAILLSGEGTSSTLLDISPSALRIARDVFKRKKAQGHFLCASLFEIPLEDNSFNLVWNVGVMEHFHKSLQIEGLREMNRVCREGGLIITAVPCVRGRFYLAAKSFAEKRGFWEVGYEEPVLTMRDRFDEVENCKLIHESSVGFLWQFWAWRHSLKMIPNYRVRRFLQLMFSVVFEVVNRLLFPLNYLPGSWLVTVCRKES